MSNELIIDIIGWIGGISVLYAYIAVSVRFVEGDSLHYQFFNVLGAVCLIINTFYHHAYPSVAVNIIWVGVAFVSLALKKKKPKED